MCLEYSGNLELMLTHGFCFPPRWAVPAQRGYRAIHGP